MSRSYLEKSFGDVFKVPNVEYEIPFFQRGYVWGENKWKELLDEVIVSEVCEITEPSIHRKDKRLRIKDMEEKVLKNANYYFGTIYLKEKERREATASPQTPQRFLIIDGQQRLITIYLFLVSLYYSLDSEDAYQGKVAAYRSSIFNDDLNNKSKIYSLKQDEQDLIAIIANDKRGNPNYKGKMTEFRKWYKKNIDSFLPENKYKLLIALLFSLKITEIRLSENDDEMLIFENLNDKGTPLTGDELLCNYIFQHIIKDKQYDEEKIKGIHSENWLHPYKEIQQITLETTGRQIKESEQYLFFLRHMFSIGRNKMIGQDKDIYYTFKKDYLKPSSEDMIKVLQDIKAHVPLFQKTVKPRVYRVGNDQITDLLTKIDSQKIYTSLTFIMPLLKELEDKPEFAKECRKLFETFYVFLVRRSITGLKKTEDNTIFPRLWKDIKDETE